MEFLCFGGRIIHIVEISFTAASFHFTAGLVAVTFNGVPVDGQESLIQNLCYEMISNFL